MALRFKNIKTSRICRELTKNTSRRICSFSQARIQQKNRTGTWLSPLEQPKPTINSSDMCGTPKDSKHRRFIASLALNLDSLLNENRQQFGEPVLETFRKYPFFSTNDKSHGVSEEALTRSILNSPIHIPWKIPREIAYAALFRSTEGKPYAASVRYTWLEAGHLHRGNTRIENIFAYQIRHHTKLEAFHDVGRPVYCVNLKFDDIEPLDLRLLAVLTTELPFLDAACRFLSRKEDAFNGLYVVDHENRIFVDEKIVRRAAYFYSNFQRTQSKEKLYNESPEIPLSIRYSHFIVARSHLPEFRYDQKSNSFMFGTEEIKEIAA